MGKTVCFTGHRPDKLGGYDENNPIAIYVKEKLNSVILETITYGEAVDFIVGGALGVDTWAGEIVANWRDTLNDGSDDDIRLHLYKPFEGQERKWNKESKIRYAFLEDRCDSVKVVCEDGYAPWKMMARNKAMVDDADIVIACWDGTEEGGTGHCVRYAQSKNKEIIYIDPNKYLGEE